MIDIACNIIRLKAQLMRLRGKGQQKMNITDVRVRKVAKEGKMKAVVSITIDEEFVVHDIKVIEGEKGLFIAMPSRKATDGEYRDIAHPINSSTRDKIQTIILEKYQEAAAEEEAAVYKKESFYIPHFMERFMKCGIFFAKKKYSCDLPKLFHGILCPEFVL